MKKIVVFLLFLLVFGTLSAWDEFNQYSIADELKKPGVKLVAVDFYATWCEPCNAAIPKWKKLQEKYGDKGFKLIVVSVQSEGSCSQPPQWNPDKIVCDYDGDIADAWHANDLPQAFLWSWQGNLLVAHGTVDNVAAAIETYFQKIPRVYVEGGDDENIYKMVRSELIKNSKIEVVASDEERKELAELRRKSTNLNYDTKMQCKLGEEVSANSRLVISTQKRGKKDALVLELFSVEKGCLTAGGTATIRGNPEQEVAEAVYNLLKNLLGSVSMPGEGGKTVKKQQSAPQQLQSNDKKACEYAKSENNLDTWKIYLEKFPNGECAFEAETKIRKSKNVTEPKILEKEKQKAEAGQKKLQAEEDLTDLQWSEKAPNRMKWIQAEIYCKELNQNGHSDWRLPNIDELRTLIINHSGTKTGGDCKISEKKNRLSYTKDWDNSCNGHHDGNYSKFNDKGLFWSSSVLSDYSNDRWNVGFSSGRIYSGSMDEYGEVRCVR